MPIKDVCSPTYSGQKPKAQAAATRRSGRRGVKHAAVYGEYDGKQRSDQSTQQPPTPSD